MRKHLSPATIIALLALFVALTGTATAAGVALITGKQIKDGSIGLADLSPRAKAGLKGARGPQGPQGAQGPQGLVGPAGGFNPAKVSYVTGPLVTVQPDDVDTAEAHCPLGTKVVGGGFFSSITRVAGAVSAVDGSRYAVIVLNDTLIAVDVQAQAICAAP
jgi:hypothetical protein